MSRTSSDGDLKFFPRFPDCKKMNNGVSDLTRCSFKVSGKVQGVYFRKYAKIEADRLGVHGWCRNTSDGSSVEGEIEGMSGNVKHMITWLRETGSPHSVIDDCVISGLEHVSEKLFNSFEIRRLFLMNGVVSTRSSVEYGRSSG
jgi:acylphosphatase